MARRPALRAVRDDIDYADLGEVAEFAHDLPERFLHCREMGHNWKPRSASRHRDGGFERILRCSRCRTERHQEITPRGVVTVNRYVHPEGYLHKGMGRIVGEGRGLLRLESIKRITKE